MNHNQLKAEIMALEYRLKTAKAQLENLQKNCKHNWSVYYDPIVRQAYRSKDPYAYYERDIYVPEKTEPRWIRVCERCGKTQETKNVKEVKTTLNGLTTTTQEPKFYD